MAGAESFRREDTIGPEQSVIGSMLIDPTVVGLVISELTEEDFLLEADRVLYRGFRALYLADQVIDPVLVLNQAAPRDEGMRTYVLQLMDTTPTAANVREYIAETRERSRREQLRRIGVALQSLAHSEDGLPLLQRGFEMLSKTERDDESGMEQCMLEFYEELDRKPVYLRWGFPFLDEGLYVEPGDFVILAGRPSDGKTALALHMAREQAKEHNVGFFSLETGRKRLFSRLVSAISGVPSQAIKKRSLSEMEYQLIAGSADSVTKLKLRVVEAAHWTVDQIEARVLARKFDVVYVDYLQLIEPSDRRRTSRNEEVADISRSLANMARKHKITVVALSQLSRPENKGKRREPVLADLRESGQIEQDADAVMFIWREDETRSNAPRFLTLAKNKEGMLNTWDIVFRGETQRFIADLSGFQKAGKTRRDPEYKQAALYDLPGSEKTPWEEDGHGDEQKAAAGAAGGGGAAAPGHGAAVPPAGGAAAGDRPGPGDGPGDRDLPF